MAGRRSYRHYEKFLLSEKVATLEELRQLDQQVEADVRDAIEFAESSPEPAADELFSDIYADV